MTDESPDPADPSSPSSEHKSHLQLVNTPLPAPKAKDSSLIGFLKSLIAGKSETTLHEALKEFVAEDDSTPLSEDERSLIANILALRNLRAEDVMIPRADIVAIDINIEQPDLFTLLSENQFSRFPVYRETLDDVIGTLHIKDVLSALSRDSKINLASLVRDVPIVSPAMHVLDLILEMKQTRRHMALVVDEFGGIDGLITVGDIIGSIVGEIGDEHKTSDQPRISIQHDGMIIADGRVGISDFELVTGNILTDEEREEIDTLGGLVFTIAGRVPSRGEVIAHSSGFIFEVLDADPRRVNRLRIKPAPAEDSSPE